MSPLFVVSDLERSLDFYTQKLGFKIDFRYEDFYAGIARDGYSIHLQQIPYFGRNNYNPISAFTVFPGIQET